MRSYRVWCKNNNEWGKDNTWIGLNDCLMTLIHGCPHTVSDDTHILQQSLGFKDKNGELIFEGDIIRRETHAIDVIGEIVWTDIGFTGFNLKVYDKDSGVTRFYPLGRGQYDDDEGDICNDEIILRIKNC